MVSTTAVVSIVIGLLAVAFAIAYQTGAADPMIEQVGIMFFKAKAEAEAKKLQAQGLQEGQDFVKDELKGSQQAGKVATEGLGAVTGSLGGLGGGLGGGLKEGLGGTGLKL